MTEKIEWNEKGYAGFEELVDCLVDAFLQGATWTRINKEKDLLWKGPDIPQTATQFSLEESMTAQQLKYDEEEQNRDFLIMMMCFAMRVGMEQEARITKHGKETNLDTDLMTKLIDFSEKENLDDELKIKLVSLAFAKKEKQ